MVQPPVLKLRVVDVIPETADAHSLVLAPANGAASSLAYRPGQFLTIRIPSERPGGAARCYSLCSSPLCDEKLKVTVKRTTDGYGSNWICDNVVAGDVLEALRPAGTFTPASLDIDMLLVAAGSGITPMMSIIKSVLHAGTGTVTLLYANRDERSVIFADELRALALEFGDRLNVLHWLESVQGTPTTAGVRGLMRSYVDREAFVCGPQVFMDLVLDGLTRLGMPSKRVHVERFTSLTRDPFVVHEPESATATADGAVSEVDVTLDGQTRKLRWPQNEKLLNVLLAAGLDAPYSCREGTCSACACVLETGEVDLERNEVLDEQDLADGIILGCQALPRTERLTVTYDS